jgi:hypothetical protein
MGLIGPECIKIGEKFQETATVESAIVGGIFTKKPYKGLSISLRLGSTMVSSGVQTFDQRPA